MNKADKIIAYVMQQLSLIGENFGWQIGRVGPTYENGYTKCNYDSKVHFRKDEIKRDIEKILEEHIPDATKKVVTNADRIRNLTDEELGMLLETIAIMNSFGFKAFGTKHENKTIYDWLKEKVE